MPKALSFRRISLCSTGGADEDGGEKTLLLAESWAKEMGVQTAFQRLATLDALMGNLDRPGDSWGVVPDGDSSYRLVFRGGFRAPIPSEESGGNNAPELLDLLLRLHKNDEAFHDGMCNGIKNLIFRLFKNSHKVFDLADEIALRHLVSEEDCSEWKYGVEEVIGILHDIEFP